MPRSKYDAEDAPSTSAEDDDVSELQFDKTFQRFADTLAQNPEQVLRYEFQGRPLLATSTDVVASYFTHSQSRGEPVLSIPRCECCGAARVFELQLVPGAIRVLEEGDESIGLDSGMEWSTIILGVCERDCVPEEGMVGFREEWAGVQWEEQVPPMK